jgi:hypothetical protein
MARCNGIFERDLSVHMNLIPRTTEVIYYNAATDPYSTATTGMNLWNGELARNLNRTLGNATFDIGHLVAARAGGDGGGDAGCIGCLCSNDLTIDQTYPEDVANAYPGNYKGAAYTAPAAGNPEGDAFDVDYVAHEMGHQMGGNHTHTHSPEDTPVQVEVGSGISIMAYAGTTGNIDVSGSSIPFFHAKSIEQIQTNLESKACFTRTNISGTNAIPTVTASPDIIIPISTPFALVARGADANATNALTYSWEQIDLPSGANLAIAEDADNGIRANVTPSRATAAKATGPNFISFAPVNSPVRYFPKMATVMTNALFSGPLTDGQVNSEYLSSVARESNFRVTVRDNAPYRSIAPKSVGKTQFDDMIVTTDATGGRFTVTSQAAAGISYNGNTNQTITWNRGSSHLEPFNATNVDILITYNNGTNWTVLLANTPNDGSQAVAMPNVTQPSCRIMVRSAVTAVNQLQSYFFNVNTTAFALRQAVMSTEDINKEEKIQVYPNPSKGDINIKFSPKTPNVGVKVYDMLGNLVFTQDYSANQNFNQAIDLSQLSKGVYMVAIFDGDTQESIKRLIIK